MYSFLCVCVRCLFLLNMDMFLFKEEGVLFHVCYFVWHPETGPCLLLALDKQENLYDLFLQILRRMFICEAILLRSYLRSPLLSLPLLHHFLHALPSCGYGCGYSQIFRIHHHQLILRNDSNSFIRRYKRFCAENQNKSFEKLRRFSVNLDKTDGHEAKFKFNSPR